MADSAAISGLSKITEGIWSVALPLPWALKTVNVFLARRPDGYFLIDCGLNTPDSLAALAAALGELQIGWRDIREIIVTHMHPDHVGAASHIRGLSGAPVLMHPDEARWVAPRAEGEEFFWRTADYLRVHGFSAAEIEELKSNALEVSDAVERLHPDREINDGDIVSYDSGTLETIVAPGHSPGLVSFYCPEKRLYFSTDVILETISPNIGFHPITEGNPLGDYLASLERLDRLDVETVIPSHGPPFRGFHERIAATREHHQRRLERVRNAVPATGLSAYEIAGIVWRRELSLMDRRFAMAEGLSHLVYLEHQSEIRSELRDGVRYWIAPS
jgi:glyoxylase-like metal-dependent hydrolase (beta-lactamase superfamily II)